MSGGDYDDLVKACRRDPGFFPREILGRTLTQQQMEARKAMRENRRLIVPSGNATGKTGWFAVEILEWMLTKGSRALVTATTYDQLLETTWMETRTLHGSSRVPLPGVMRAESWEIEPGWDARCISVNNRNAFQGRHPKRMLLVFDEALGIESDIWKAGASMMQSPESRWIAGLNPLARSGEAYRACHDPDLWKCVRWSCLDHPNVKEVERAVEKERNAHPELSRWEAWRRLRARGKAQDAVPGAVTWSWVEEMREHYGESDPEWQSRVLGEFPDEDARKLFPRRILEAAADLEPASDDGRHIGVDVALMGDQSVAALVENGRLAEVRRWRTRELMNTVGDIEKLMEEWKVEPGHVHVDKIGMGEGVCSRLREKGLRIDAVDMVSVEKVARIVRRNRDVLGGVQKLKNVRAALYFLLRRLLEEGMFSVPRKFEVVWADLLEIGYGYDSSENLQIEGKHEMRKRLGRSPDCADAVVMSLSRSTSFSPSIAFA